MNPPVLAEALLERLLPPGVVGESILGDLRQELDEREAAGRRGLATWYWAQAIGLGGRYAWLRVTSPSARRRGGGREAAPRGPVTRQGEELMDTFVSDLRYGLRMLVRTPMLSTLAVLTIALGVGLTSHTFSTVYGTVIRGLDVPDADRLVIVAEANPARNIQQIDLPIHDFLDLRAQVRSFEFLAGFYQGTVNLSGDDGPPERYQGGFVSANTFTGLGVAPLHGRTFREGEDLPGAEPVILLGYDVWRNRFGADPDVVGRTIRANGESATVVGVMPDGVRFPFNEDLWVPHRMDPEATPRRDGMYLGTVGRLKPGVSFDAATAEVAAITRRLEDVHPENRGFSAYVFRYQDRFMPAEINAVMYLMLAATFGVLLIACANVANLLLARATIRGREVAIRTALGASRTRVVRQLLSESLILGLVGGALGLALSWAGIVAFNAAIQDIEKPYWIHITLDGPSLVFTVVVTLLAAVVAGTLPAVRASGSGIEAILRDESRGSSSLRLGRFSSALVVGELAVSCGLLVGAGLMIKSIVNLETLDLGFESEGVMTARVGLFDGDYPTAESRSQFFQRAVEGLAREPGATRVSLASSLPGMGAGRWRVALEGEAYDGLVDQPVVNGVFVAGGFFEVYDVEPRQGRTFVPAESWAGSEAVAVVNESLVRRLFPGTDPLGQRIKLGAPDGENPWMRIVGVVPDLHIGGGVGGIGDDRIPPETVYANMGQADLHFVSLIVKTQGPPQAFVPSARRVVSDLDPNLPLYDVMSQDEALDQATWAFGLFGSLFAIFGVAALFLASVGLYGVMAFSVSQRRQEMGVRMALGASGPAILRLVLRRGVLQLAVGLTVGLALGAAMGVPLRVVTFGVESWDAGVYAAIVLTLGLSGVVATLVPALRATRVDPNTALRPE